MTERGAENRGKTSSFKKEGLCWRTNKLRFEKISPTISANYENWFLEDGKIDVVLGEMEKCGGQFYGILKEGRWDGSVEK